MDIHFKSINIDTDFSYCVDFRRDSYFCSFGTYEGFDDSVIGYEDRMRKRMSQSDWFYYHIWSADEIIGQLEFKSFSDYLDTAYVHLIYIVPKFRGLGIADLAHAFIVKTLISNGCKKAILSVSRINHRALQYYKRLHWEFFRPNPKHQLTDYYVCDLINH